MRLPVCLLCFWTVGLLPTFAGPVYPDWWFDDYAFSGYEGVTDDQPPPGPGDAGYDEENPTDVAAWDAWMQANYAPANIGQAKNMAKAAFTTMEAAAPGTAGTEIADMISGFSTDPEDNYAPLNLGQLKYIAEHYYDVFHAASYPVVLADGTVIPNGQYPWNPATPLAQNYAPANLGQLKYVFSFDLTYWPYNESPTVVAGPDKNTLLPPGTLTLTGSAYDPNNWPQPLTVVWSQVSGPGTVVFDDAESLTTDADFPAVGTYVLRLTASDGAVDISDELTVTVNVDSDENGIDDAIDAAWDTLLTNDPGFVSLTKAAYYDPTGIVAGNSDLLPVEPLDPTGYDSVQWDYDGDGISNYQEFLNGTNPADFFNGKTGLWLRVTSAEGENVAPLTFIDPKIKVEVLDSQWNEYANAPILFSTENSYAGLAGTQDPAEALSATYATKTSYSGAKVEFFAPNTLGPQEVTASLPDGTSLTVTIYVVSASSVAKLPTRNFRITETFDDGSQTFAWTSDDDEGDWFQIVEKRLNGTFEILFETTYGSAELPYVSGHNTYSITLDKNYQPVAP